MAQTEKKKEYFIKQGYSRFIIEQLEQCGVSKHMLWFLTQLDYKSEYPKMSAEVIENIKIINEHIESMGKNTFKNIQDAFESACSENAKKKSLLKNALHIFKDGYSIVLLEQKDLYNEGLSMSNCVGGYKDRIVSKERALLAVKNPEGDTVVHFEIMKNGMLAQNFEKANMPVRNKYWKYVYEFLEQNSKYIPDSKHFGFAWSGSVTTGSRGISISANCIVPIGILKSIDSKGNLVSSVERSAIVKSFNIKIPKVSLCEFEKKDFVKKLNDYKAEMIKSFDEIITSVELTEGRNLFVSDEVKARIFGEGFYLMKGDDYNALDITMFDNDQNMIEPVMVDAYPIADGRQMNEARPREVTEEIPLNYNAARRVFREDNNIPQDPQALDMDVIDNVDVRIEPVEFEQDNYLIPQDPQGVNMHYVRGEDRPQGRLDNFNPGNFNGIILQQ